MTLHFMEKAADTGEIVGQSDVNYPEGITAIEADRQTAQAGAKLLRDVLNQDSLPHQPQVKKGASYHPQPTHDDLTITADWEVRRAFNFLRGADEWAPFWIRLKDGQEVEVTSATTYSLGNPQKYAVIEKGEKTFVQMRDGVLEVIGGIK